ERRRLLHVRPELVQHGAVEPELPDQLVALGLGEVAAAEQVRDRIRGDDPEQEEVERDDEEEGRERPSQLPYDVPRAHSRSSALATRDRAHRTPAAPTTPTAQSAMIRPLPPPPPSSPPPDAPPVVADASFSVW